MATKRAFGGFDHPTAIPENFDPETIEDGETGADASDGGDDASGAE